jgi:hypothetical protein
MSKLLICGIVFRATAFGLSTRSEAASEQPRNVELAENWKLVLARNMSAGGQTISLPNFETASWHSVARMPATVCGRRSQPGEYYGGEPNVGAPAIRQIAPL